MTVTHSDGADHHHAEHGRAAISRRRFIEMVAVGSGGAFLAACGAGGLFAAPSPNAATLLSAVSWYGQSAIGWKGEKVIYFDPGAWLKGKGAPQADLILITHAHADHYSKDDLGELSASKTTYIAPADVAEKLGGNVKAVKPGDSLEIGGVKIQAVPAYNIGEQVGHPKANNWVGYIVTVAGRSYYHAGDTDNLPELASVKADAAFVPIGGSGFTMGVDHAAGLVKAIKPTVAVPIHFGFVQVPPGAFGNKDKIVVGVESDGPKFKQMASPVEVTILNPLIPYVSK